VKVRNPIRMLLIALAVVLLFPTVTSAALPPTVEPQWNTTMSVGCNIILSGNVGAATASIIGYTGSVVEAYAVLFMIKDGERTDLFWDSTPSDWTMAYASFGWDFTPVSGATYYLVLSGLVTGNGTHDDIYQRDVETVP